MLSRGLPPLRRVYCYSCQKNIQARGIVGKATRERILSGPKKRGAPKGRPKDPNDPSKTVNRNTLINWKPRGPRGTPTHLKNKNDAMGKMVHDDVDVDLAGIPEIIPKIHYRRHPMLKAPAGSYEDAKNRRFILSSQFKVANQEIQNLVFEIDRFKWEMEIGRRPPVKSTDFDINNRIIESLRELRKRAIESGSTFKAHNYDMAIRSVEAYPSAIKSGNEMLEHPGIGPKTAEKIQEIIDTGNLRRLSDDAADKKVAAVNLFSRIPGVGPLVAEEFVERGLLTLNDLRAQTDLTEHQKLGLQYFDELETKIPQDEMHAWNATILTAIEQLDQDIQATLVGPYRRRVAETPEIDVLVTHPDVTEQPKDSKLLDSITQKLHSTGHIAHHLDLEKDRYEGIARLPPSIFADTPDYSPFHRMIKFRLVPWDSFVYAQLHYTGTEAFMRHLREQAARRGYQITPEKLEKRQKTTIEIFGVDGLRFMEKDKYDTRNEGDRVVLDSEEDVFRFLKMNYVHPHNRNWF